MSLGFLCSITLSPLLTRLTPVNPPHLRSPAVFDIFSIHHSFRGAHRSLLDFVVFPTFFSPEFPTVKDVSNSCWQFNCHRPFFECTTEITVYFFLVTYGGPTTPPSPISQMMCGILFFAKSDLPPFFLFPPCLVPSNGPFFSFAR